MGVSGQRHAPAALLPPGKGPPVPVVQEAGWAPEPVWTALEEKSFKRYQPAKLQGKCWLLQVLYQSQKP